MQLTEDLPFQALRRTWQPVANAANLARAAVTGCTLLDTELVLARFADGRLLAADVACPHKGMQLSAGCIRAGEGRRITLLVDGRQVAAIEDTGASAALGTAWTLRRYPHRGLPGGAATSGSTGRSSRMA